MSDNEELVVLGGQRLRCLALMDLVFCCLVTGVVLYLGHECILPVREKEEAFSSFLMRPLSGIRTHNRTGLEAAALPLSYEGGTVFYCTTTFYHISKVVRNLILTIVTYEQISRNGLLPFLVCEERVDLSCKTGEVVMHGNHIWTL